MMPEEQKLLELIQSNMNKEFNPDDGTIARVYAESLLNDSLDTAKKKGIIANIDSQSKSYTAWDKMNRWQRIKWFLVNKAFPFVGAYLRLRIHYDKIPCPYWLEQTPKLLLLFDFSFQPITTIKRISGNYTLNLKKDES